MVLDSFFSAAQPHVAAGRLLPVNYNQLPEIVFSTLLAMLRIDCTQQQLEAMRQRSGFHSKYTGNAYAGDPQPVRMEQLAQAAALCQAGYQAVEQLRTQHH